MKTRRIPLLAGLALALAACAPPGAAPSAQPSQPGAAITAPVTPAEVAKLGNVTLKVWADAGEKATLDDYIPAFEKKYPNVKVQLTMKGFDDLIKTVVNALNSDTAPDVAQGNQGYSVDGALVQAGLIRPLDDVAKAYGWPADSASMAPFRWSGKKFGSGQLYGSSPVVQTIGIFYNKKKLASAGLSVPRSFADLETELGTLKARGDLPIMFGNSEKYPAIQVYGAVAGASVPPAETGAWVNGTSSKLSSAPAQTLADWAKKGYFPEGFNGIGADDAAVKFAKGQGAFYIAGDWNGATISKNGKAADFGFIPPPPGPSGKHVTTGSLGLGWHISTKTKVLPAAAAFIADLHASGYAQKLTDQGRVPAFETKVTSKDPLIADAVKAAGQLNADNGITPFLDWTTDSMYDEFGSRAQELLAGRLTPEAFTEALRKNWTAFQ